VEFTGLAMGSEDADAIGAVDADVVPLGVSRATMVVSWGISREPLHEMAEINAT
jgi:hypothetical protein